MREEQFSKAVSDINVAFGNSANCREFDIEKLPVLVRLFPQTSINKIFDIQLSLKVIWSSKVAINSVVIEEGGGKILMFVSVSLASFVVKVIMGNSSFFKIVIFFQT